jgi:hypothetical protein
VPQDLTFTTFKTSPSQPSASQEPPYQLDGHLSAGEAPQPPTTSFPKGVDHLDYLRGFWRPIYTVCRTLLGDDKRPYLIAEVYGLVNEHHYSVRIVFSGVDPGSYTYYPLRPGGAGVSASVVLDGTKDGMDYLGPRNSWNLPISRFDTRAEVATIAADGHSGTIDAYLARGGATTAVHLTGSWRCA